MADMPAVSVLIQVPPVFLIFARSSRARVEQSIPGRKDGFPKVKAAYSQATPSPSRSNLVL